MSKIFLTALAVAAVFAARPVLAQVDDTGALALEEDRYRQELEGQVPVEQEVLFDWGGWFRFTLAMMDDHLRMGQNVTLRYYELRPWMNLDIGGIHQFYVRAKFAIVDYNEGDSFDMNDDDVVGPNLDQGFYRLDVTKAAKAYLDCELPLDVSVKVGRQFNEFGQGIVYSELTDGVNLVLDANDWKLDALVSRNIESEDNIDSSVPDPDHSRREFGAFQFTLKSLDKHEPYVFAVFQHDASSERPEDPWQDYDYDSRHIGFGSTGEVVTNLRYYCEGIYEAGRSYASWSTEREHINAYAFDVGMDYYWDIQTHPRFSVEWAYGSGDPYRWSATNTIGGNMPGTSDRGFLHFGYLNTGYVLAAKLANLQLVRLGGSIRPLEGFEPFDKMELGSNFFFYWKDEKAAGISDMAAFMPDHDIGNELDVYTQWQVASDVALAVKYGVFFPGDAYFDNDERHLFLTSLTISF